MSDFDRWNEANAHAEPNMLDRIAELEAQLAEAQAREAKLIAAIRNVPLLMSGVEIRDWQSVVLKETDDDA